MEPGTVEGSTEARTEGPVEARPQPEHRGVVGAVKLERGDLVRLSSDSKQYEVVERVAPRGVRCRQVANPRVVKCVDERSVMLEAKGTKSVMPPLAADTEDPELHRAAVAAGIAVDVPTADDGATTTAFRVSTEDAERHERDEAARVKADAARVEELRVEAENAQLKVEEAEKHANEVEERLVAAENAERALEAAKTPPATEAPPAEAPPENAGAGTDPTSKAPSESTGGTPTGDTITPALDAALAATPAPAEAPPAAPSGP